MRDRGPTEATVELVLERCSRHEYPSCEVCGDPLRGERGVGWSLHHRRYRDGSPDQHSPANLIAVCGGSNVDRCHGLIHSGKAHAIHQGWSITRARKTDPASVPVLIDRESRWTHFTADGRYSDDPAVVA